MTSDFRRSLRCSHARQVELVNSIPCVMRRSPGIRADPLSAPLARAKLTVWTEQAKRAQRRGKTWQSPSVGIAVNLHKSYFYPPIKVQAGTTEIGFLFSLRGSPRIQLLLVCILLQMIKRMLDDTEQGRRHSFAAIQDTIKLVSPAQP
jgi:hypothetical protein